MTAADVEVRKAPGAALSVVWAVAGMVTCGVVLGAIAMVTSLDAQRRLEEDPSLGGRQLAAMGYWFGVVAIVQHIIRIGMRVSAL